MSSQGLLGFPKGEVKAVSGTSTNPGFGTFAFPRGGGTASKIRTYQDNFTSTGAALGLFTDGTLTWQNVGSGNGWSNQNGNSYNTGTTRQAITWIDFNKSDVTITANANYGPVGGGIVFRQTNSDNYWLFAQESQYELRSVTLVATCVLSIGPWGPWTEWSSTPPSWDYTYREPCSAFNYTCCGPSYVNFEREYEQRMTIGGGGAGWRSRSRQYFYNDQYSYNYDRRDYVTLYKIQNGTITSVWRRQLGWNQWPSNSWLKVQISGSTIMLFSSASGAANNFEATITDSFNQNATRHGMGRDQATHSSYRNAYFWDSIVFVG